jgi:large subunit ribosomal protein L22
MEAKAIAKYIRISPRKVRLLMRELKGKKAEDALNLLTFAPQKGAPILRKLIKSAVLLMRGRH